MNIEEVNNFLEELRSKVSDSNPIAYINRPKNRQALIDLQIRARDRTPIILNLTHKEYSKGPEEDHHGGSAVWVFGTQVNDKEVYIKITLKEQNHPCTCISFHLAEYLLHYPLANQ